MTSTRTLVAMVIGAVIFAGGFIGGFVIQAYFGTRTSAQNPPSTLENLTVERYTPRLLTEFAVEFILENNGASDIQIADVKLNGYSNQTTSGMSQGWNGTTFLHPNQTGPLYVYAPSYTHVINQTMPQLNVNPTQTEIENLETWMYSYNTTFTFTTETTRQYNYTIPGLGFGLAYAITTWAARSTQYSFMATEQGQITNLGFDAIYIYVTFNNTGTTPITINEVWVNNLKITTGVSWDITMPVAGNSGGMCTITYTVVSGAQYEVKLVSSKGNAFVRTGTAPT